MYSGTSENANFMNRVASHSTKGTRGGVVRLIPNEAKAAFVAWATIKQQWDHLKTELAQTKRERDELSRRYRAGLNEEDRVRVAKLARRFQVLHDQERKVRKSLRKALSAAKGEMFLLVAMHRLDPDVFKQIDGEAEALLSRPFAKEMENLRA